MNRPIFTPRELYVGGGLAGMSQELTGGSGPMRRALHRDQTHIETQRADFLPASEPMKQARATGAIHIARRGDLGVEVYYAKTATGT